MIRPCDISEGALWDFAIAMQDVGRLEASPFLREVASETAAGA